MIETYLSRETKRINDRFLGGAKTLEEWQKIRPVLKQEYLDMLGLWPLPEKTPLKATITGTVEQDDIKIDLLHYQSKPGLYVTGNLYRPKKAKGKLPAVLYVCGHSGRGRDGNKTAFQDHGVWFARNGYICLIVDTLQLGEVAGIHHGTYNQQRWWWQSRGYTPAGVECWNGIRGIDYLISRPDVDPERIAVTGISGGGASTVWIAAADDRVKCAVPVSGMSDLESYVTNKVINGHCDCMFLVNQYGWEWTTIAALIAPRPMLFANSDNDRIFPMDGNRRIIDKLRQVYKMHGKPDLVDEYVSKGGHDYRPDLRVAIFSFINKHLKNDNKPAKELVDFKPLPGKDLRVFLEDIELPKDAINKDADELFLPAAKVNLPDADNFGRWQKTMMRLLKARTFREFPDRFPAATLWKKPPRNDDEPIGEFKPARKLVGDQFNSLRLAREIRLATVSDIVVMLKRPRDEDEKVKEGAPGVLLILSCEEEADFVPFWATVFIKDGPVRALVPRTGWTTKNPPNYVERSHALLGQTVDLGRIRDIAATVRYLSEQDGGKTKWKVVGRKEAGVLAVYAAMFEPTIAEVIAVDPPPSHRFGPTLLGVMRVLDIPEAMGLLAPRPLTIVNPDEEMQKKVTEIYKASGSVKQLKVRNIAFR